MKSISNFKWLRTGRGKYLLHSIILASSLTGPLVVSGSMASAAETSTDHPDSTAVAQAQQITVANGSLWYVRSGGGSASTVDTIGNMTTSGTTTNYSIMPSGATYMRLTDVTTGPDGNVWFVGCSSASTGTSNWTVQAGFVDVSTGAVTFYPNTMLGGTLPCNAANGSVPGLITTGSDGNLWYVVNTVHIGITKNMYLFSVNPTTGVTTTAFTADYAYNTFYGMTTGPDGKLWITEDDGNRTSTSSRIEAFTISAGSVVSSTMYTLTGTGGPTAITNGPDGNLWFIGSSGNKISKVTTTGAVTTYSLSSGVFAQSLATGPTGDNSVWFTTESGDIGRMTTTGSVTQYATNDTTSHLPWFVGSYNPGGGLVLGPDNAMWFPASFSSGGYGLERFGY